MIMSLELAGVFNKISGLIIGGMTNMGDEKENRQYEESFDGFAYKLISERISKYNFPVVFGFPNGHIRDNRPLIIGGMIHVKAGKTVSVSYRK
jgi:muramoyltetrapeptide carboxypeptidase